MKEVFGIEEIALMSGLSTRTIRTYIASGFLKGEKTSGAWRFTPEALEEFFSHKAVVPAIRAKRNAIVYDFASTKPDGSGKMCVLLDLPIEKAASATAFFCKYVSDIEPQRELRFAADKLGKGVRIILSGSDADLMKMLAQYYSLEK